jgi:hypothetical protein
MNPTDEMSIRDQLDRAVRLLDPVAPALDNLRARAGRRRRNRRATGGFMAVGVVGAMTAIFATVIVGAPSGKASLQVAAAPTHQSLVRFATANGGLKIAGPYGGKSAWYGAFSTKHAIVVADYDGTRWRADGPAVTSLGKGQLVTRLGRGPQLGGEATPTSFAVRVIGGDVSYFGSVLRRSSDSWGAAKFGGCGHSGLCYTPSTSEPYGHRVGAGFVSVNNNCTPNCAVGTEYRVTWRWSAPKDKFLAVSEHAPKSSHRGL